MVNRIQGWLILCALMLLSISLCAAQDKDNPDYVLGPGDVIEVTVPNIVELGKVLVVLPDGKIAYPEVGELVAAGKKPVELAAAIQTELEKNYNNVTVFVTVKEIHSRRVRIVGAIKNPFEYDVRPGWRVLDVVTIAGGLTTKPNMVSGKLIRGSKSTDLDIQKAIDDPTGDANIKLQADDLILLDELDPARNQVHVMGAVGRAGAYDLQDGMNLLSLLSQAGNVTDMAALTKAYILRGTTDIPMNLYPIMVEGKADDTVISFKLKPGDILFIPPIEKRFAVLGAVNHPGYLPLPEKKEVTVAIALGLAGGGMPDGDLKKAGIIRNVNGKPTVLPVNIEDILNKGSLVANVMIQPEDILYIPPRRKSFVWSDVLSPITALGYLGLRLF